MWWLYFRWQWLRDAHNESPGLQGALAALFFLLAGIGAWYHLRHDKRGFVFWSALMLSTTLILIFYLNFKYGASQAADGDVAREVRDRDYFYLWSFSAWGVWASLGLVWTWQTLASVFGGTERRRAQLLASPVLLLAFVPLVGNWSAASRRDDQATLALARDLLNSVEPYGVLVTAGDNDTFPLWYAQEVEGIRRDVTVAVLSLMNTDWFARGIIRRPVREYDAARGPAVYRDRTLAQADASATADDARGGRLGSAGHAGGGADLVPGEWAQGDHRSQGPAAGARGRAPGARRPAAAADDCRQLARSPDLHQPHDGQLRAAARPGASPPLAGAWRASWCLLPTRRTAGS